MAAITPRPLLLMHGTEDPVIPAGHSERIFEAANHPNAELWLAEGARHAALINHLPDEYRRRIHGFLERAVGSAFGARRTETMSAIEASGATTAP